MSEHNFVPHIKQSQYSSKADMNASFSGHYYELYKAQNIYSISENFALSRVYEDLKGYVLTITSKEEENFIRDLMKSNQVEGVWLGAHDSADEVQGEWRWNNIDGGAPESGQVFFSKKSNHITLNDTKLYSNWRAGEPNDADSDEDCSVVTVDGWNDVRCGLVHTALIVEYGSSSMLPTSKSPRLSSEQNDSTSLSEGAKKSHEEL